MANTQTSIYDPRMRTPIKKEEPQVCVTCGQPLAPKAKLIDHDMSHYLNGDDRKTIVVMSGKENVVTTPQGVSFYRIKERSPDGGLVTYVPLPEDKKSTTATETTKK